MTGITIKFAGRELTQGEWFFAVCVAEHGPRKFDQPFGMRGAVNGTFDSVVSIAKTRGFKERRQLLAAMRKGKHSPAALTRCETVCALLAPAELAQRVSRVNAWLAWWPA